MRMHVQSVKVQEISVSEGARNTREVKDPRDISPCHLTNDTFLLKFPFIQIYNDMSYWEGEDRCGDNFLMDYDTIQELVEYLGPSLKHLFMSFTSDGGEMKTRPIHCGLLHEIRQLVDAHMHNKRKIIDSKHSDEGKEGEISEVSMQSKSKQDLETNKKTEQTGMEGMKLDTTDNDDVDNQDAQDSAEDEGAKDRVSNSPREGTDIGHETTVASGFADILVKGFDKAYITKCGLHDMDPEALCTFLILDGEGPTIEKVWRSGPGGAYQTAAYGVHEALKNLKKGRTTPIHLQAWSKDSWGYGLLAIERVVRISKEGEVIGHPELQEHFKEREVQLQSYLNNQSARYDAREYLVAKLYISDEVLLFPSRDISLRDSYRFFESLVRICFGDAVLGWKVEDVKAVFKGVEEMKRETRQEIHEFAPGKEMYARFRRTKRVRF